VIFYALLRKVLYITRSKIFDGIHEILSALKDIGKYTFRYPIALVSQELDAVLGFRKALLKTPSHRVCFILIIFNLTIKLFS
jgi:hypothetical protein